MEEHSPAVMFTDDSPPVVNIVSVSQSKKDKKSLDVQTLDLTSVSRNVQTSDTRHAQTQTAPPWKGPLPVDYTKLAAFLRKVVPDILEVLSESNGIKSLDEYDAHLQTRGPSKIDFRSFLRISTWSDSCVQMKVSDLSWSTNDEMLAISHSASCHPSWCDHLALIQFYRISNIDGFDKTPARTLETNGCVTCLSYHLSKPSLLVAGLFNGDVLVWDLSNDDPVSPLQVCTHEDSVSQVYWISEKFDADNGWYHLMTSSKNGDLLIHRIAATFGAVELHKRLRVADNHKSMAHDRPQSSNSKNECLPTKTGAYVTCFDFSWKKPILLIVGTLCGRIYKCSLDPNNPTLNGDENLLNPAIDEYEKQQCSITCVKCSPSSNLFVTGGSNKEIRVYNFEESTVIRSILVDYTVVGLTWITGYTLLENSNLFAAYGAGRSITFYNVTNGTSVGNVPIGQLDERRVTCMRINSKGDAFAIGDTQGSFEIWKMYVPN